MVEPARPAAQGGRLYLRKWKIRVYKNKVDKTIKEKAKDGSDVTYSVYDQKQDMELDVSHLRCVFRTRETVETHAAVCTLEIYNLSEAAEAAVIREGFQISIEAGYQQGRYGLIFEGDIVQVIRNRENGIDYKLEILALSGSVLFDWNHTRCAIAAQSTPYGRIREIAKNARATIPVGDVSPHLSGQTLPRGKVFFGDPKQYYRDLAIDNDAYYYAEDGRLTIKKTADAVPEGRLIELSPETGLVGTPQYGDDGIHIKMLMDCRVKKFGMVKINNERIRRRLLTLNVNGEGNHQLAQQRQFDEDGEYQVFSVSHHGDTYGDDWTTEVLGIGRNGRGGLLWTQEKQDQTQR